VKTDLAPKVMLEVSPYLNPEDIAGSIVYVLGTPPHVQASTFVPIQKLQKKC
jgi:NADP-dependent 3-hydroxy acid dehydrogenase YdfG